MSIFICFCACRRLKRLNAGFFSWSQQSYLMTTFLHLYLALSVAIKFLFIIILILSMQSKTVNDWALLFDLSRPFSNSRKVLKTQMPMPLLPSLDLPKILSCSSAHIATLSIPLYRVCRYLYFNQLRFWSKNAPVLSWIFSTNQKSGENKMKVGWVWLLQGRDFLAFSLGVRQLHVLYAKELILIPRWSKKLKSWKTALMRLHRIFVRASLLCYWYCEWFLILEIFGEGQMSIILSNGGIGSRLKICIPSHLHLDTLSVQLEQISYRWIISKWLLSISFLW
jgi:hypothetical protein